MADNVIEEGRSRIEDILLKKYEGQPLSRIEEILLDLYNDIVHLDPETGLIPMDKIPPQVFERMITVTDDTARFALTTDDVQNGDVVYVNDAMLMYFVVDDTHLSTEAGYMQFAAGIAAKAVADKNGNDITTTYATKTEVNAVDDRIDDQEDTTAQGGNGYAIINGIRVYVSATPPTGARTGDLWIGG